MQKDSHVSGCLLMNAPLFIAGCTAIRAGADEVGADLLTCRAHNSTCRTTIKEVTVVQIPS